MAGHDWPTAKKDHHPGARNAPLGAPPALAPTLISDGRGRPRPGPDGARSTRPREASRVTTARTCTAPPPRQAITTGPIATATRRTPPPYDRRGSTSTSCPRRRRRPGEVVAFACASEAKRASRPPGNRECFAIWGGTAAEQSPCIARDTRKAYSTDSRVGRLCLDGSVILKIFILMTRGEENGD